MSEIVDNLKDDTEEFWIGDEERKTLCEVLAFIGCALERGQIWFNKPGPKNREYAKFCQTMAKRFANMPVRQSQ